MLQKVANASSASVGVIENWDLSLVRKWLIKKGHYAEADIDRAAAEYRHFLAKIVQNPNIEYEPGLFVDPFWHGHILFTEDYGAMCKKLGFFIHHRPSTAKGVECTCCNDVAGT